MDNYVNPNPVPEHKDYQWSKHDKIRGLGRLTLDELNPVPVPGKNPRPLRMDLFGAVAIGDLSPNQIKRLLSKTNKPHDKRTFLCWAKPELKFEKYIVKEINKLPERDVGRVVRIQTLYCKKGNEVNGICLNKYKKPNRKQFTVFVNGTPGKTEKIQLIKDMAMQLKIAFNQ